ncbi:MAG: endolytic transglycosylase MltG [Candidatus Azobacteroides sp.]|nr:endolytic transglycosylase MltG [Candidatus Azobacteroides sp.]
MLVVAGAAYAYYYYFKKPNFFPLKTTYIYIRPDMPFDSVLVQLRNAGKMKDEKSFLLLSDHKKYPGNIKPGRYAIKPEMNNDALLRNLITGKQTPVKLTFNNIRTIPQFAGRIADQLMTDSLTWMAVFQNKTFLSESGFTYETLPAMFIPNTYEMYWNVSPEKFCERMKKEYERFWNPERTAKAGEIGLTPVQVSTLASIVEEETNKKDELPIVAGLYINRLKTGMKLQADPTVKFAVGDFSLRRVLNVHLGADSPYNTYQNYGLPPGPIRFPSIRTIDAVLNYTHHNYIYMCAKEDLSGRHNFAVTAQQHNANRDKYIQALNRLKIYK